MELSDKPRWNSKAVDDALERFVAYSMAVPGNQRTAHTHNGGAKRRNDVWIATYTAIKANGVNSMFACFVEKRGDEPIFVLFDAKANRDPKNWLKFRALGREFGPGDLEKALGAWREVAAQAGADELEADIAAIEADCRIHETTRRALVAARRGQGRFRDRLMRRWGSACAVTGLTVTQVLRASHSKPWRDSSNEERLDPGNGVLLAAHLDALFDGGLISFDGDGAMLVSPRVSGADRERLGIPHPLRESLTARERSFMGHHRDAKFRR